MLKKTLLVIIYFVVIIVCTSCVTNSDNTEDTIESSSDTTVNNTPEDTTASPLTDAEIAAIIDKNLNIILADGELRSSEQEYIDAYPEAFAEIAALGEAALPYLENIADNFKYYSDTAESYRYLLAMYCAYMIKPELYDLTYPSPDGRYALNASVNSFFGLFDPFLGIDYKLCVIECDTNATLIEADGIFNFPPAVHAEPTIKWSADSKYVAIVQGYRHYYGSTSVFVLQNAEYIILPGKNDVEKALGRELVYYDDEHQFIFDNVHLYFDEFGTDTVKIRIMLSSSVGGEVGDGFYIYDLLKREITHIEFDIE